MSETETPIHHLPDAPQTVQPPEADAAPTPRARRHRPYKRRPPLGNLFKLPSGRTAEGRRLRDFKAALVAHVGGQPNAVQGVLIDRAVVLQCFISRKDTAALQSGDWSIHATREYLSWTNTLARTLAVLGMDAAQAPKPSWQERIKAIHETYGAKP